MLAERRRNHEIAEILGISTHTAERHTENVLMKLGVHLRDDVRGSIAFDPSTDATDAGLSS